MPDAQNSPSARWENVVAPETARWNETHPDRPGRYTFNQRPPDNYEGPVLVLGAAGLGEHAHVLVESGQVVNGDLNLGKAGVLILRWPEWARLRDALADRPGYLLAEVRHATPEQVPA